MHIRLMEFADVNRVMEIWNESVAAHEVVYYSLTESYFEKKFLRDPHYDPKYSFVATENGRVIGFISGIAKKVFLPKETHENTPGFLTCLFVDAAYRRRGTGTALLNTLMQAFRENGKQSITCGNGNPINLDWTIPGTERHDHNNTPGVDEECQGHPFLLKNGFEDKYREVAMYLNLKDYVEAPEVREKQEKLKAEGIATGRYDVALHYDFDGMCDRVGSEYWRKVLQDETHATSPRPILAATYQDRIVGFTGPVDKQESGRGWFTGICTDPLFERKGIATVLFNLLMQEFIAEGATFSTLFTGDDNHAQRVYLRAGLRVVRRFVIMSRTLSHEAPAASLR
ncbi:MAG: GNAT family N-acetyltransferase [Clostridia bacterium]